MFGKQNCENRDCGTQNHRYKWKSIERLTWNLSKPILETITHRYNLGSFLPLGESNVAAHVTWPATTHKQNNEKKMISLKKFCKKSFHKRKMTLPKVNIKAKSEQIHTVERMVKIPWSAKFIFEKGRGRRRHILNG